MLTLALLQQTDALAVMARAIAQQFSDGTEAALAIVPVDLGIEVEAYGMISRERVALTPAAQRLADQISAGGQIS
jgi:DNA-binding transcriptional LysR family regulator